MDICGNDVVALSDGLTGAHPTACLTQNPVLNVLLINKDNLFHKKRGISGMSKNNRLYIKIFLVAKLLYH